MKNAKLKKRLTRAEKIAQGRAIKKGVISDPRHLIGLPQGNYRFEGEAAKHATEEELKRLKGLHHG